MAVKKVIGFVKLQVTAGAATPAPPVGTALGPQGVNIMDFCKQFNARTQSQAGIAIPVEVTIYHDRSFTFITKTPPAAALLKKELGLSDTEYRDTLEKITGVRSAKYLDDSGFRKLMNYFARSKYYRLNAEGLTFRQKMYIKGLRDQLHWDEQHFVNFLKKYYKKSDVDTLTRKEAVKVIESLKNIQEHERIKKQK